LKDVKLDVGLAFYLVEMWVFHLAEEKAEKKDFQKVFLKEM
jgi:hypothetical protein